MPCHPDRVRKNYSRQIGDMDRVFEEDDWHYRWDGVCWVGPFYSLDDVPLKFLKTHERVARLAQGDA